MIRTIKASIGSRVRDGLYPVEGSAGQQTTSGYYVTEVDQLGIEKPFGWSGVAWSENPSWQEDQIVNVETAEANDSVVLSKPRRIFNPTTQQWRDYRAGDTYVYPRDRAVVISKVATKVVDMDILLRVRLAEASAGHSQVQEDPRLAEMRAEMERLKSLAHRPAVQPTVDPAFEVAEEPAEEAEQPDAPADVASEPTEAPASK